MSSRGSQERFLSKAGRQYEFQSKQVLTDEQGGSEEQSDELSKRLKFRILQRGKFCL